MLKRFFVNNFQNLLNIEIRPVGVNLLIGHNNAGKIEYFKFYDPDPEFIHFFLVDKQGRSFSAHTMSDGTLRYLALCCLAAFLEEPQNAQATQPPSLVVVFEEPENGIYVGYLKRLFERFDFSGNAGQCFFTSHSPYVIDLFDGHPESLFVMKPGVPSCNIAKPDLNKIGRLLDKMPLGEMHYREMLE